MYKVSYGREFSGEEARFFYIVLSQSQQLTPNKELFSPNTPLARPLHGIRQCFRQQWARQPSGPGLFFQSAYREAFFLTASFQEKISSSVRFSYSGAVSGFLPAEDEGKKAYHRLPQTHGVGQIRGLFVSRVLILAIGE
jgi:hypothetical protein